MKYIKHLILLSMLSLVLPTVSHAQANNDQSEQSNTAGKRKGKKKKDKRKGKKKKGKKKKDKRKGKKKKGKNKATRGAKRYPMKINARPLVLPTGLNEVSAALEHISNSQGKKDFSTSGLAVTFRRGIIPNLEIGASTGLALNPEVAWASNFTLRGGYKIAGQRKGLALAAQVEIPLTFGENQDVLSSLSGGLAARYRFNKRLAIYSGEGLISLNLGKSASASINIPIGVGFQVNKQINLRADTRIVGFGGGNVTSVADSLPLHLRGFYTINRMMDAGLALKTDAVNDSGWSAMAMFNYRM